MMPHFYVSSQGHREGGAEGVVCPRASGSRGPHQLKPKFLLSENDLNSDAFQHIKPFFYMEALGSFEGP